MIHNTKNLPTLLLAKWIDSEIWPIPCSVHASFRAMNWSMCMNLWNGVRSSIANQTKKKIKITRDYDLSLPEVLADRDQLIQVILNICANAVQAMTENKEFFVEHQPELILRTRIQRLFTINGGDSPLCSKD